MDDYFWARVSMQANVRARVVTIADPSHSERGSSPLTQPVRAAVFITNCGNCLAMASAQPTTITVPVATARRLKLYKTGGRTYAEVLEDLMDAVPPREFLDWAERELRRRAVPWSKVRQDFNL